MLDYHRFPWFERATMQDVRDVELRFDHLFWPSLDVDLDLESLDHPERFPLLAAPRPRRPRRASR